MYYLISVFRTRRRKFSVPMVGLLWYVIEFSNNMFTLCSPQYYGIYAYVMTHYEMCTNP